MKLPFEQALQMLERQGKPSIFRILMQPMSPSIIHMPDVHIDETVAVAAGLEPAALEPAAPEPAAPPSTPDTPKPVIFITPLRYELYTVVVLKKWWRKLTCRGCKTDVVGFKPTMRIPV